MIFKKRADFDTQEEWLYYLYNNLGNNLKICMSGRTELGEIWFSKRYSMEELYYLNPKDKVYLNNTKTRWVTRTDFISKATHRTILDIEIVFDIDEEPILETAKRIIQRYKNDNPICYFTGSKSYHIHIFNEELRNRPHLQKIRHLLITQFLIREGADSQKGSSNNMIAIEGSIHYKSGKPKTEVIL